MTLTNTSSAIDVRTIDPRNRHALIFSTFESLPVGDTFELTNDHDPKPLYFQFQTVVPGRFGWDYLQAGPEVWRVRIRKLADPGADPSAGQCCGSCGG